MNVVSGMPRQPPAHLSDLVRAVVVHDQMHLKAARKITLDLIEKPQELLMPVSPVARADGHSGCHIHGREQRRDTMALVVVRLPGRYARSQRQNRLRSIQRLHLTLLIHTQYDRSIRRIQIQPHDIPHLLHELRILGELEVLHAMRLQSESMPNPHNGILRETRLLGHEARAPVRAVGRHRFQCLSNDVFHLLIGDLARRADPRLIEQAIQPKFSKPFPPLTGRRAGNVQLSRDLRIAHPLPTTEYNPGAHRHGLRRLRSTRHHTQFLPIRSDDFQRFLGATCTHTLVCRHNPTYATYFSLRTLDQRSLNINTFNVIYVLMGHALPEEAQSRPVQRAGETQAGVHAQVSNRGETAHSSGSVSFGFAVWPE